MGNTKHRKNHDQKLKARKTRLEHQKNRTNKYNEYINDIIKKEKANGAFENTVNICNEYITYGFIIN